MARDFQVRGQTLVVVETIDPDEENINNDIYPIELGLTIPDGLVVTPKLIHKDIKCDDFGPDVPPEIMFMLAEVRIKMQLVHFDEDILRVCADESMGGSQDGVLAGAGTVMGGNRELGDDGNHYIGIYLLSVGNRAGERGVVTSWHFLSCFLTEPVSMEYPIGVNRSIVTLNWRCIPYKRLTTSRVLNAGSNTTVPDEVKSAGSILWDREIPDGYEYLNNIIIPA